MSELGKKIRLSRIIEQKTGKTVVVAMDHAIAHGVIPGIDHIKETMAEVLKGRPNAITIHKGLAEYCFKEYAGKVDVGLLLKVSSFSPYHPTRDVLVTSVEEAVSLGADGVSIGATVCGVHQYEDLRNVGILAAECRRFGMPLIAHIYPKGESIESKERFGVKNISYAARAAAELGVDIVKTWYTGDSKTFKEVVETCPVPVVIAGGPKGETPREVLQMVKGAMEAGAAGVTFGRNIWQYKNPAVMIRAIKKIVQESEDVDEALKIL